MRIFGGPPPTGIQSGREIAATSPPRKKRVGRAAIPCHPHLVGGRSSKLPLAICQYRYPSPTGWPEPAWSRSPHPIFITSRRTCRFPPAPQRLEYLACRSRICLSGSALPGAVITGEQTCFIHLNLSRPWPHSEHSPPVRGPASNAPRWAPSAGHWQPKRWIPMLPVAVLSAVFSGRPATRPGCAPRPDLTFGADMRAAGVFGPGSLLRLGGPR